MTVIYSKLGGCLGTTTKLGPLARTDLCTGVKGLLDRLMTHLGLVSFREDPWGLLGGLGMGLPSQIPVLSAWETVLFPWEVWGRWVPAWEAGEATRLPPSLGEGEVTGLPAPWEAWETWLPAWDAAKLLPSLGEGEHLSGKPDCLPEINCFLPQGEGECLPVPLSCFLPQGEGECLAGN